MKTVLSSNPYVGIDWGAIDRYKTCLHAHTTQSDGDYSVAEVIKKYHEKDYKILSITDHDNISNAVIYPWTRYPKEGYTVDPEALGMLAVKGIELSNIDHIGSYFNDVILQTSEEQALTDTQNSGGLSVFNHPGRYGRAPEWYTDFYKKYSSLVGMEVYNQKDRYPKDRVMWDNVNALTMPGKTVWGLAGDDMHTSSHIYRCYQIMLMPELTEQSFRKSFNSGAFYFCYEPEGSGDGLAPRINRVEATGTAITLDCSDYSVINWITEGSETAGHGEKFNFSKRPEKFVRAEIVNARGKTYTQPFGLTQTEEPKRKTIFARVNGEVREVHNVWARTPGGAAEVTVNVKGEG